MLFDAVFSVSTCVGGCRWTIYARAVLIAIDFLHFSNNFTNSASLDYAIKFLIILHYTCTGTFLGGFDCIGVLDFGPSKNTH